MFLRLLLALRVVALDDLRQLLSRQFLLEVFRHQFGSRHLLVEEVLAVLDGEVVAGFLLAVDEELDVIDAVEHRVLGDVELHLRVRLDLDGLHLALPRLLRLLLGGGDGFALGLFLRFLFLLFGGGRGGDGLAFRLLRLCGLLFLCGLCLLLCGLLGSHGLSGGAQVVEVAGQLGEGVVRQL